MQKSLARRGAGWVGRVVRWFFGSPVQNLPPEFGNPVPAELQVFEAEVEEKQHHIEEIPAPPGTRAG